MRLYKRIAKRVLRLYFTLLRFLRSLNVRTPYFIYYWAGERNFGDQLNLDLLRYFHCRHIKMFHRSETLQASWDGVAIGSILQLALESPINKVRTKVPLIVYGSGFLNAPTNVDERFTRPLQIVALRGHLSKERCERILHRDLSGIVLGDPGLLIRRIFPNIRTEKKYDVGIVYHWREYQNKLNKDKIRLKTKSFRIIPISGTPADFVQAVAECRFILSSAMHALICADSLGIPNQHVLMSYNNDTEEYKFRDYYSVFPEHKYKPIDLREPGAIIDDALIDTLTQQYDISQDEVNRICDNLERVFPFK